MMVMMAKKDKSGEREWGVSDTCTLLANMDGFFFGEQDGCFNNRKFEDVCQALSGIQSYVLSPLDKLIYELVGHLCCVASDDLELQTEPTEVLTVNKLLSKATEVLIFGFSTLV
ncbi:hypothetical protein SESBI_38995 [Sesbania bispinosa]|nr:hypothetical protein SESBI_38995 [Sesbania bispinosa]